MLEPCEPVPERVEPVLTRATGLERAAALADPGEALKRLDQGREVVVAAWPRAHRRDQHLAGEGGRRERDPERPGPPRGTG